MQVVVLGLVGGEVVQAARRGVHAGRTAEVVRQQYLRGGRAARGVAMAAGL